MFAIHDPSGRQIHVGSRIDSAGALGTVTDLIEPDLDTQPRVAVLYDDGQTEAWPASQRGPNGQTVCDDVDVVA